jgi:hypothetical protein
MSQTTYREESKTKCPACQRSVASVREYPSRDLKVSRHLYQEQIELNAVGAPVEYADGFCPGSFNPAPDVRK